MTTEQSKHPLYIPYAGYTLLELPLLNKGSAFTEEERSTFNLHGLIPHIIESIEEQSQRSYQQYSSFNDAINKHIYLRNIQDTNETLFYHLIENHLSEMMPIIYTPTVGEACQRFSDIYRRHRGIFISYPDREHIDDILQNVSKKNVKVIVITDGERILGLGDQGIGGMGIPIGKLSLYTACGGISPAYTLPITIDVGTNNQQLLNDPIYMGWRQPRITGDEYYAFIDQVINAIKRRWPKALIQFEDFAQNNAMPILQTYRNKICCFNDDIQGTAAVSVGSLIAASRAAGKQLKDQVVAFLGAGSAGCGIAEQIVAQMVAEGLTDIEARARVYMVDRFGLITENQPNLRDFQRKLAQRADVIADWADMGEVISLLDVVRNAQPSVLIGVSGQPGLFTEEIIKTMHAHCERPIVMPLSNPTSQVEAVPADIIQWTEGKALIATGSPFAPVNYHGKIYEISQCNNSYIFPGIGLGVIACGATRITDSMLMASSNALADCSPMLIDPEADLLPSIDEIQKVSKIIAFKVAKAAMEAEVAPLINDELLQKCIEENFWKPEYRRYKRIPF
ncbi:MULTISPECIES: NAD-dependent malic enzyme [Acinetobacter]|jgi:malate dehydrogenase (oxaloacetate-decarboxylating)|uniref:NAD-dependent malic enzyme n=1 Tax=Acinetobacter radioresistens TaxID=40216 RepID=A0A8H2JYV7_ACIRA|nr:MULTISPECIES: NAD-dependent malic enzyme [Acinetobacter]ENV89827.1 NAD-dependent malic enzyme [Acinetobacter radioresistens DSM 6976 = NBRC 102413 = CIP 103788]EXB31194.1 malic enzyme, NAD binding domain protein [Acinetobacter sp. 1461402]EXB72319.1 malic enzyme, NAD binding domain protein [Acinetobacter sp. 230853]EXC30952.1 malic enzyme, NAD binding domain protein [Acinetobacter sp. 869535]KCX37651.1 malic enzyme, NAD binding domain protein [Acinetobacter sp. 263903-1]